MHCYGIILTVGIYNIIERDDNAIRDINRLLHFVNIQKGLFLSQKFNIYT